MSCSLPWYMYSLASQTLTLHSVLVFSGKTRGGRVWPTAYTRLDPARQDVVWPIRFVENMITSRSIFILRIAGAGEVFWKLTYRLGIFYYRKSSVACSSCFFVLPWLPFSSEILNHITQLNVMCRNVTKSWIQTGIGSGPDPPPACLS